MSQHSAVTHQPLAWPWVLITDLLKTGQQQGRLGCKWSQSRTSSCLGGLRPPGTGPFRGRRPQPAVMEWALFILQMARLCTGVCMRACLVTCICCVYLCEDFIECLSQAEGERGAYAQRRGARHHPGDACFSEGKSNRQEKS